MKLETLTPKMLRHRKILLAVPLLVLPFLTMLFWALGGGKGSAANAQPTIQKGFNDQLPDAKLKDNSTLNKMSYYQNAEKDSVKLKQQMQSDPYYHGKADSDTSALHFPHPGVKPKPGFMAGAGQPSKLIGSAEKPDVSEARVYQKLAQIQKTIDQPEHPLPVTAFAEQKPEKESILPKTQPATEDPQLTQMNSLLEKILDIQHPERAKPKADSAAVATNSKFKAIPAVIDGKQKITEGSVVRLRILDTITLNGQFIPKGQLLYGKGTLYNQRLSLNLKMLRIGTNILPINLTVYDMTDGMEGINVPEAVTGDEMKNGAATTVQGMEFMSLDPSMTAQLTGAGINTAKNLFSKKVKRVKATLKDGHALLLRVNNNGNPAGRM